MYSNKDKNLQLVEGKMSTEALMDRIADTPEMETGVDQYGFRNDRRYTGQIFVMKKM